MKRLKDERMKGMMNERINGRMKGMMNEKDKGKDERNDE